MQGIYDLVIAGGGIQSALLLAGAVEKGLKVALVLENDNMLKHSEPFVLSGVFTKKNYISFSKAKIQAQKMIKSAQHLFIQTSIDHAKKKGLSDSLLIFFSSILRADKISQKENKAYKYLTYSAFKFSSDRLIISLLKYARNHGADIFQPVSLVSSQYTEKQCYKINLYDKIASRDFMLFSKSILIKPLAKQIEKVEGKKNNRVFKELTFTYPYEKLKLDSNLIFETKDVEIRLIPWFDFIYVKIRFAGENIPEKPRSSLNKYLNFIELDDGLIRNFKISEVQDQPEKENLTFHFHDKSRNFKLNVQAHNYNDHLKLIHKIAKQLHPGRQPYSKPENMVLPGVLPITDLHPLRIMEYADEKYELARQIMKSPLEFKKLFYRYGSEIELIINKAYEFWNIEKDREKAWLKAELWFCIHHEMCKSPENFIHTHTSRWMAGTTVETYLIHQIFNELKE